MQKKDSTQLLETLSERLHTYRREIAADGANSLPDIELRKRIAADLKTYIDTLRKVNDKNDIDEKIIDNIKNIDSLLQVGAKQVDADALNQRGQAIIRESQNAIANSNISAANFQQGDIIHIIHFHYYQQDGSPYPFSEPAPERKGLLLAQKERYKERENKKIGGTNDAMGLPIEPEFTTLGFSGDYFKRILKGNAPTGKADFETLKNTFLAQKRLLVIGEPGSGKTVLMLRLILEMTELALNDKNFPLPVMLNLASWRKSDYDTFEKWLEKNLVYAAGRAGISKEFAQELVYGNQKKDIRPTHLLLFLDGLDEVPEADRPSCIEELTKYLTKKSQQQEGQLTAPPLVAIACRKGEYEQMNKDFPVHAIAEILPLNLPKLQQELKQKSGLASARALHSVIDEYKEDIQAKGLLTTAFEVNLLLALPAAYLVKDFTLQKLQTQHIVDTYIEEEIKKVKGYKPEKTKHYLSQIAQKLQQSKKTITFELIDIQPDWLQKKQSFKLMHGRLVGLQFVMVLVPLLGPYLSQILGPLLAFMLLVGFSFLVVPGTMLGINKVRVVKSHNFNTQNLSREEIFNGMLAGVVFMGLIGLATIGSMVLMWELVWIFDIWLHAKFIILHGHGWLSEALLVSLLVAVALGAFTGLIVAIRGSFVQVQRYALTYYPYQRLQAEPLLSLVQLFLFTSLSIGLFNIFYEKKVSDLSQLSYLDALHVYVSNGVLLFSCLYHPNVQHLLLRFLLWREGTVPLRLVSFLYAVGGRAAQYQRDRHGNEKLLIRKGQEGTGLMENDGGEWRFRHQLIQDRLAGKDISSLVSSPKQQNNMSGINPEIVGLVKEGVEYAGAAAQFLKDTGAAPAIKTVSTGFFSWLKNAFTRKSQQETVQQIEAAPNDEKLRSKLEILLENALADNEIELQDLKKQVEDFRKVLSEQRPELHQRIQATVINSKNTMIGGNVTVHNGGFRQGDNYNEK